MRERAERRRRRSRFSRNATTKCIHRRRRRRFVGAVASSRRPTVRAAARPRRACRSARARSASRSTSFARLATHCRDDSRSHDRPELRSWVESANDPATDFPIQNLPFGVFVRAGAASAARRRRDRRSDSRRRRVSRRRTAHRRAWRAQRMRCESHAQRLDGARPRRESRLSAER